MRASELECIHRKSGMLSLRFLLLLRFSPLCIRRLVGRREKEGEDTEWGKEERREGEKKGKEEKMPVAAVPRVGRSSGKLDERGVSLNHH